jgi:UDP-N-acetylenolpyruvoylglucosamine reductase
MTATVTDEPQLSFISPQGVAFKQDTSRASGTGTTEWHNWHNTVICRPDSVAYPWTVEQVVELVKTHARVRVVGLGHSFNTLTCGKDLMLTTMQMDQVLGLDKLKHTVTTQAGVKTRNLIHWLRDRGYALPTAPYYIDQSIAGAVATSSHGSSVVFGSLSSLVKAVKIVLADGSIRVLTEADGDLFSAAKTSVGALGVVVELTLAVQPNEVVWRGLHQIDDQGILAELKKAEHNALAFERVHYWYSPPLKGAAKTTVDDLSHKHEHMTKPLPNIGESTSDLYYRTVANSSLQLVLYRHIAQMMKDPNTHTAATYVMLGHIANILPGAYKLSDALPAQQVLETDILRSVYGKYEQYEFAVALDKAHDCVKSLFELFDRNVTNRDDFRVPFCLRYVGPGKEGLLGISHGGTRFYLNMDNYDVYNRKGFSQSFQVIKDLMASQTCQARMHYGKASIYSPMGGAWRTLDARYVQDTVGHDVYARFVAAAKTLDPAGKFADGLLIPN